MKNQDINIGDKLRCIITPDSLSYHRREMYRGIEYNVVDIEYDSDVGYMYSIQCNQSVICFTRDDRLYEFFDVNRTIRRNKLLKIQKISSF